MKNAFDVTLLTLGGLSCSLKKHEPLGLQLPNQPMALVLQLSNQPMTLALQFPNQPMTFYTLN